MTLNRLPLALLALVLSCAPSVGWAQSSAPDCAALASYRDANLLHEWNSVSDALRQPRIRLDGLKEQLQTLREGRTTNEVSTALGAIAHSAKISADLIENVASMVNPGTAAASRIYGIIKVYRKYKGVAAAGNEEEVAQAAAGIVGKELLKMNALVNTLGTFALNSGAMVRDMKQSHDIELQLTDQMHRVEAQLGVLDASVAQLNAVLTELQGAKDAIDKTCGGVFGCTLPGTQQTSRPGTVRCLAIANPALCPSCKDGWRHRCEAGAGNASAQWHPLEECLTGELKTARSADSHTEAAAMFSAQSSSLRSAPSAAEAEAQRDQNVAEADARLQTVQRMGAEVRARQAAESEYDFGRGTGYGSPEDRGSTKKKAPSSKPIYYESCISTGERSCGVK